MCEVLGSVMKCLEASMAENPRRWESLRGSLIFGRSTSRPASCLSWRRCGRKARQQACLDQHQLVGIACSHPWKLHTWKLHPWKLLADLNLTSFNHAGHRMLYLAWIYQPQKYGRTKWNTPGMFLQQITFGGNTQTISYSLNWNNLRWSISQIKHLIRLLIQHNKSLVPADRKNITCFLTWKYGI